MKHHFLLPFVISIFVTSSNAHTIWPAVSQDLFPGKREGNLRLPW